MNQTTVYQNIEHMTLDIVYDEIQARLIQRLRTDFSEPGFDALGTVDVFSSQFAEGSTAVLTYPAILLEFAEVLYTQQGKKSQQGQLTLRLHVAQEFTDLAEKKTKGLAYLDFVHRALHGHRGTVHNGLMRTRSVPGIGMGNVMVNTLEYVTRIWDNTADPSLNWTDVTLALDEQPDSGIGS